MKKETLIILFSVTAFFTFQSLRRPRLDMDAVSPALIQTTDAELQQNIQKGGEWVLLDFWSPACGPCVRMKPELSVVAELNQGRVSVLSLKTVEAPRAGSFYGIRGIPALVLLRNGTEVDRRVGFQSSGEMQSWLDLHLNRG